jgi:sigma-B regulation protein RsbU (phosphoserine phosphatase)
MPQPVTRGADLKYRLMLDISQQISRTLDLQEVVSHLLESLRTVVDYDAAGIFVLHRSAPFGPTVGTNLIAAMATIGFDEIDASTDPMLRSGKGIVGHVIRTGEVVVAGDVTRDSRYVEGRLGTQSELAVPIISNGEVIGALNLESNHRDAFSQDDAELLEAFAVAAAISIEKAVLHRQVVEKHLLEQQLKIAREVQISLLPAAPPVVAGYDIDGLNLPAWDIGGDYFDYLPLGENRLGLVIADVSGKGVPAALLMATFRAALRTEARRDRPIPAIIEDVHRTLTESMDNSRYVTAVYGVLDTKAGTFSYVNCGHNRPMLLHAGGGRELLPTSRRAVGMFGSEPAAVSTVTIGEGDVLLLYTDGVADVTDGSYAEFGEARVADVLSASASGSAREIVTAFVDATRAHAGRDRYDDDFTLMVVKRFTPPPAV